MSRNNEIARELIGRLVQLEQAVRFIKTLPTVTPSEFVSDGFTSANFGKLLKVSATGGISLAKLVIGSTDFIEHLGVVDAAGGRFFIGNSSASNRNGLIIQSSGTSQLAYSRLQAWNYDTSSALDIALQSAGGKVGIGTTAPAYTLDINGAMRVSSTGNPAFVLGNGSVGYLKIGSSGWYDDGTYLSPSGTRAMYIRATTPNYYNYAGNIFLGYNNGSTIRTRGNSLRIGENVSGQDGDLTITVNSTNYNAQKFYFGTELVGELGAGDTNWLRINQTSGKNIYTPEMFRADGGFQVGSSGGDFHVTSAGYVGINKSSPSHYLHANIGGCDLLSYSNGIGLNIDTTGGWARSYRIVNEDSPTDESVAFGGLSGGAYISAGFNYSSDTTGYLARNLHISSDGDVGVGTDGSSLGKLAVAGHIIPSVDNSYDLGLSSRRFDDVYATNGTIQTSDRRNKALIKNSILGLDFVLKLRPVSYKWRDYTHKEEVPLEEINDKGEIVVKGSKTVKTRMKFKRKHYGFIAQEVEEALEGKDFAGLTRGEDGVYGLRYQELIAPMVKSIQELSKKNDELNQNLSDALSLIEDLSKRLSNLENG